MNYEKLRELCAEVGWEGINDEALINIRNWLSAQTVIDLLLENCDTDEVLDALYGEVISDEENENEEEEE